MSEIQRHHRTSTGRAGGELYTVNDHTTLDEVNRTLAEEEERYREEIRKGGHGAHAPCETFPIEEARERGVVPH